MPRPRKAIRPVEKNISLPQDLVLRVDLKLWSELEGKVPFGAWQRYVEGLIRADLEEWEEDLEDEVEPEAAPHPICADCNGSGEGMYDGTTCHTCHGRGTR